MLENLTKSYLPQGLPLVSTTSRSNAVVVSVEGDSVTILTDYGNILRFAFEQLQKGYKVHEEYLEGYPITPLHERLESQIELLTEFKESIEGGLL